MNCTHFFKNYYKFVHTILTLRIGNCNITNRSTKILFSYLWSLDPPPDQVLCALVCKDFSHGQPDVLHLSCVVEKLLTLGGKEEERRKGRVKGKRDRRNSKVEGGGGKR